MELFERLDVDIINLLDKHNVLNDLIKSILLEQELRDVVVEEKTLLEHEQQFFKNRNITRKEDFDSFLKESKLSKKDFIKQLSTNLKTSIKAIEKFQHKAEERFLERKEGLDRVVYRLLRVSDFYLARELFIQINEGEASFQEIAQKYSEGPEKASEGIIGPIPMNQAHPKLFEVLRSIQPGSIYGPFQVKDKFLVVQLESFYPAIFDESTKQIMSNEIFNGWLINEAELIIKELLKKAQKNNLQENSK